MKCENCGKIASNEVLAIVAESNYDGDYFCSDECRNQVRDKEDIFNGYRTE